MDRAVRLVAVAAMAMLPGVALAETQSATISPRDIGELCDQLASHPDDTDRAGIGVVVEAIDVRLAEPVCRAAVEAHPDEPRYLFELGRVLRQKLDYTAALPLYEKAASMGSLIALVGLGLFYENGDGVTEDYEKAAGFYRKAADGGSALATRYLASLYEYGDIGSAPDYPEAIRLYRQAVDRGDAVSLNRWGWLVQLGMGVPKDEARAEALFRQAMASSSDEAVAEGKNNLAWMWALSGKNLVEAERLAAEAVAGVRPDVDWSKASYLDTLAWVKHRLGRNAEALRDGEQVVALVDDYAPYYARLGDIYAATGDKAKAVAAWRKALDIPPPLPSDDPMWNADDIRRKIDEAG